jgi:hypothetical protein
MHLNFDPTLQSLHDPLPWISSVVPPESSALFIGFLTPQSFPLHKLHGLFMALWKTLTACVDSSSELEWTRVWVLDVGGWGCVLNTINMTAVGKVKVVGFSLLDRGWKIFSSRVLVANFDGGQSWSMV